MRSRRRLENVISRFAPNARMSQVVEAAGTVYVAGQVAHNRDADVRQQTRETLEKIDALLALAGCNRSHLVSVNVYLAHISDFDAMNEIYDAWIDRTALPARACTEARLADPRVKVEITAIAAAAAG